MPRYAVTGAGMRRLRTDKSMPIRVDKTIGLSTTCFTVTIGVAREP